MKVPQFVYLFLFGLLLFCGSNLIGAIGIDIKFFYAAIMLICIPLAFYNRKILCADKRMMALLLFCVSYGIQFMYYDRSEGSRYTAMVIMLTPVFFSAFPRNSYGDKINYSISHLWNKLLILFVTFFVVETVMASVERIMGSNILGWQRLEEGAIMDFSDGFRSSALHSHPLYNALIVSTSMAFILTSKFRLKLKLMLWMLGFFSILCFNTRSSIVGNAVLLFVYTIYILHKGSGISKQDKRFLLFFVSFMVLIGSILFFILGFGSRLAEMGLFDDDSAMVRVDVFNIFDYYPLEDFLWGMDYTQYEYAMYYAGVDIIENFFIAYLLRNGIVFLIIYITLYLLLINKLYSGYDKFTKWFTGGTFLLIAATNNSLSTLGIAFFLFLMLIVMFNPVNLNK